MSSTTQFSFPTTIAFGAGSVRGVADQLAKLNSTRALVVTDAGLAATPIFSKVIASLPPSSVFSGVRSNPLDEDVRAATEVFRRDSCDAVIGLGGGSALDVAKVLRLSVKFPNWKLSEPLPSDDIGALAPFIAIPTTAGTGSEVGRSSVITIGNRKHVIFHPSLLARLVILDPELTVDLPAKLTAATGADALTHCIESFTSPTFHPMCDGIALEGIRVITDALPRAVKSPRDLDARGKMLMAATMGGVAFQKDLGAAHSLAHPLSAICNLHHGLANAAVLTTVMKFNTARKPGTYARVATAMNCRDTSDRAAIDAVANLFADIGIPRGLASQGVTESQLDPLADQAFEDGCHLTNPVPVTRADLLQLYREAM